jgi:hypothetical protein
VSRADSMTYLRIPPAIKEAIVVSAERNRRSMTAEIVLALSTHVDQPQVAPADVEQEVPRADRHQLTPYPLRCPPELRAELEAAAKTNLRSLNAEILARLSGEDGTSMQVNLRDHFASQALPSAVLSSWPDLHYRPKDGLDTIENVARLSYQLADAMLKARVA